MGGQIVLHSFRLVFSNLSDALKVSIGPYAIGLVLAVIVLGMAGVPLSELLSQGSEALAPSVEQMAEGAAGRAFAALIAALILLFVSSWVAVAWHRFVLLEEYPGMLPALAGRPVGSYIGKAIKLALVLVLVAIPLGLIVGLVMAPFVNGSQTAFVVMGLLVAILFGAVLTMISIRLGLILPAVSLNRQMTLKESWAATRPVAGAIMSAVLILVVLNVVASGIVGLILGGTVLFGIVDLIVSWVSLMVGLSILTTVYGHVIEGRSID